MFSLKFSQLNNFVDDKYAIIYYKYNFYVCPRQSFDTSIFDLISDNNYSVKKEKKGKLKTQD